MDMLCGWKRYSDVECTRARKELANLRRTLKISADLLIVCRKCGIDVSRTKSSSTRNRDRLASQVLFFRRPWRNANPPHGLGSLPMSAIRYSVPPGNQRRALRASPDVATPAFLSSRGRGRGLPA